MKEQLERLNLISGRVIGAAIEVHRELGPGWHEKHYENALCIELELRNIKFVRQKIYDLKYKEHDIGKFKLDLLVEDELIVEAKVVEQFAPIHEAQVIAYLTATNLTLGLLLNFNVPLLKEGIKRVLLTRD